MDDSFDTVETEVGSEGKQCDNTKSVAATDYSQKQILADTLRLITTEQTARRKRLRQYTNLPF